MKRSIRGNLAAGTLAERRSPTSGGSRLRNRSLDYNSNMASATYAQLAFHGPDERAWLPPERVPPKGQLLKWIGNKQRSAEVIASYLPPTYSRYVEPFVGAGAVLATMSPREGLAGDVLAPLIELWRRVQDDPQSVIDHYSRLWAQSQKDKPGTYYTTLARYNRTPNGLDLMFLCRACYGGVVRFTKRGTMSTPVGPHRAMPPDRLATIVDQWRARIANTEFRCATFEETMSSAREGDVLYCDPPYAFAQQILYGAQSFQLAALWNAVRLAKRQGASVALSLDGHKRSGNDVLHVPIPDDLFLRTLQVDKGGSMLKRFQRKDRTVHDEGVSDRLLLSW